MSTLWMGSGYRVNSVVSGLRQMREMIAFFF